MTTLDLTRLPFRSFDPGCGAAAATATRSSRFFTLCALNDLPLGVLYPRALRHWAMLRRAVTCVARISCMTGSRFLA